MLPMKAKLVDMKVTKWPKPKTLLTLELLGVDFTEAYDQLKDKLLSVTIKPAHRHRSLNANAYAWQLMDQIADVLTVGKADAALAASIFHYGEIPIPVLKQALRQKGISIR